MSDPGADIRALESRLANNTSQINRLTDLCGAIMQRMAESTGAGEIDGLRGELTKHQHEIRGYGRDSAEVMNDLSDLRKRRAGSV